MGLFLLAHFVKMNCNLNILELNDLQTKTNSGYRNMLPEIVI
jgi:hypothetical protein